MAKSIDFPLAPDEKENHHMGKYDKVGLSKTDVVLHV